MKISDERLEVAARLRNLAAHRSADEELTLDALGLYRGENVEGYDIYGVMHLTDLIDPTCYVIETTSQVWSDASTVFYTHELSCGHTYRTDWPEPPAFCDECGARVVSE